MWRWLAADEAPRPAHLALWWLTPPGWSLVVSEAERRVRIAEQLADSLQRDLAEERAQCARLLRMGYGGGSANAPVLRVVGR
ncbi:MAG: hypothetical protein KBC73_05550 [Burkholderiaceae bacterium]|nr:hypothetical protein [Burkholderiaceae bacterium]